MTQTTKSLQTGGGVPEESADLTLFEPAATVDVAARPGEGSPRRCAGPKVPPEHRPLAPELHPRRRLLDTGPEALSGSELLALLLGGEAARSLELAADLVSGSGGLAGLRAASYHDLTGGFGLSEARAGVVLAAVELAKRFSGAAGPERPVISSPEDVNALLGPRMRDLDRENFVVVLLDTRNQVLGAPTVSVGTLSSSLVHPREVFRPAIKAGAASIVLAHNHPSGSTSPSAEDRQITNQLVQAGKHIRIEVLDHVIIARDGGFFSLKEHQML